MRAVIVMYDSLNRHFLQTYGCSWTHTPNFMRLASRSATFDNSYICSMPCMPARRDFHTGRPNFLHRAWGPIEPFDDSVPEMLKAAGVHPHLSTDHQHYWEDGGCTYHTRYKSFDLIRGQEGDPFVGQVRDPEWPDREIPRHDRLTRNDSVNRQVTTDPAHYPMNVTFEKGLEFIRRNHEEDKWMLQIETFDPHEPFFSFDKHRALYQEHFENYKGKPVEWPPYREVRESRDVVEHARYEYAALMSACDAKLGEVLDTFDELDLWKDTMLIVWTDHGFLLGEHGCWAKSWMPFYNEIARTPFFLWDPRHPESAGQRRQSLVQPSIDLGPTLLDFFGLNSTKDMTGKNLKEVVASDKPVREYGIFGMFGRHVNITDGKHVYMRGPVNADNQPLFEYTLMPTRMNHRFSTEELSEVKDLAPPFSFTKNCPTLKVPASYRVAEGNDIHGHLSTRLYDLEADPGQLNPIENPELETRFSQALKGVLEACNAPPEQYQRLGL